MDLPEGWTTGTVRANGIDVHYYRVGEGPPLVLNHGVTDDGQCWAPLAEELREGYDVVMPDARGHGQTESPAEGYGIDDRVADLVGLVDALDLADPILMGHSYGGSTVLATAARHPDLPRAAVLEDPAGMLTRDGDFDPDAAAAEFRENLASWRAMDRAELVATFAARGRDPELSQRLADARERVSPNLEAGFRAGFPDPADQFPEVACPLLVLKADADEAERAAHRSLVGRAPNGRIVHVDGAGHCVFRDRFDAASAVLSDFLADV
ncbi:MAG: alpha/beta fold hydrolase [Halobacteriaceae archaeon]